MVLVAKAPAKLNLYLHVLGRRADGYHRIESAVVFTELADEVRVAPARALSLTLDGAFADAAGEGEGNLVLKAARLLQAEAGVRHGAALALVKNIPVGAGLGGGSADAAAALNLLNQLWALELSSETLHAYALELGADVAMCLLSKPLVACGIGEKLNPITAALPLLYAVLVHPRTPLLTAAVYGALRLKPLREVGDETTLLPSVISALTTPSAPPLSFPQIIAALAETRNDLQPMALAVSPLLAAPLHALETATPSASFIRMTGSGACCYALYETRDAADAAAAQITQTHPHWWVCSTAIS